MDWIEIVARFLSFWLDKVIYGFIPTVYNILIEIAETTIFSQDVIDLFASKIYALLGIFMLFKVSFSILTYIVDPDAFLDKSKGFSKLISNIIMTLVLLVLTPWIFSQAMEIQSIVLRDNIIGSLFSVTGTDVTSNGDPGNKMAYETFKAFYHIDTNLFPECESGESSALADPDGCVAKLGLTGDKADEGNQLKDTLNYAYNTNSVSIYMDYDLLNLKDTGDEFVFYYLPVVSTICGVVILLLLIVFCFDIAVRSIKLGFLNVIAPIPIISRIDPKKGKETFDKWVKMCISTYLDLFIRLLAIYFAVFIISQVIDLQFVSLETGTSKDVGVFVKVFIILGALLFAKQFPKLIEDITGIKMDGKFTLNPLKKLGEVPGVEKIGGIAGGTVAGIRAGSRVGNPLLGAGMGFIGGYKSASWVGNGKGGFMAGANSTYKQLMGKDFLNFQFKPGGEKAIKEIKGPLNQAYAIKTQLEKNLNMVAHQSSQLASNLVNNGVDVNGDLSAQSSTAKSNVSNLTSDINKTMSDIANIKTKIGQTKSKTELNRLNNELANLENHLSSSRDQLDINNSIIRDIDNYQQFSQQESSIRTALSKVQKDIDDLSKEKNQRQNFYGVDPSPAADIKNTVDEINKKGINKYI